MRLGAIAHAVGLFLVVGANTARADAPSLELRGWNPPVDPAGGLSYEPAASPDTLDWNVALWQSYGWRPVVLRDPVEDDVAVRVLDHQYGGDLILNVGFFERFSVG